MNILPIIVGISGTKLTDLEQNLLSNNQVAGFILFSRNITDLNQLTDLTKSLKNLYDDSYIPLIFIDQEGGRVQRIKPPIAQELYNPPGFFAQIYNSDPAQALAEAENHYYNMAKEARRFNIDSLAMPLCDLRFDDADNVIGDRSFDTSSQIKNPQNITQVVDLADSTIRALLRANTIPIIKHIPGHGRAKVDSHFFLPCVEESLETLEATDFAVFRQICQKYPPKNDLYGMSAHIIYKAIDPANPATISPKVINYVRQKIGFVGTLITDSIDMLALHGEAGFKKATIQKLQESYRKSKAPHEVTNNLTNMINSSFNDHPLQTDLLKAATFELDENDLENLCKILLAEIQPEITDSLSNITFKSLKAGCDLVLQCSGDFQELEATIAGALSYVQQTN